MQKLFGSFTFMSNRKIFLVSNRIYFPISVNGDINISYDGELQKYEYKKNK